MSGIPRARTPRRLRPGQLRRLLTILKVGLLHLAAAAAGRGDGRLARWLTARLPASDLDPPERLRTALEELGGTFIKLGQMLALQPDILPLAYCDALYRLLDRVAPFPYPEVERIFREELGRAPLEVFDSFSRRPLATASIGQVHEATLDGRRLAVKVQRPAVDREFTGDIRLMEGAMALIRRFRLTRLYWLLEPLSEFVGWTREELDYRYEARFMERLRGNAEANPHEHVPAVVWELTTRRLLVADFLAGSTVLGYLRALEAGDELTVRRLAAEGFEPRVFARHLIENFLGDAFRHGAFHADLHPANLMILPGNVVGYLDFGITGVLSRYSRRHLVAMTLAYASADLDGMARSFFRVSSFAPDADRAAFRAGLEVLAEAWFAGTGRRRHLATNFTRVMLDMLRLSRETGIWPERDVIKYIRSAIAIDGLITRFAPGFDVGAHLQRVCRKQLGGEELGRALSGPGLLSAAAASSRLAADGPNRLQGLLQRLADRELVVDAEWAKPPRDGPAAPAAALLVFALLAERAAIADPSLGLNLFTALAALAVLAFVRLMPALGRPTAVREIPHA